MVLLFFKEPNRIPSTSTSATPIYPPVGGHSTIPKKTSQRIDCQNLVPQHLAQKDECRLLRTCDVFFVLGIFWGPKFGNIVCGYDSLWHASKHWDFRLHEARRGEEWCEIFRVASWPIFVWQRQLVHILWKRFAKIGLKKFSMQFRTGISKDSAHDFCIYFLYYWYTLY